MTQATRATRATQATQATRSADIMLQLGGTDAWSREARRVREQATRVGLALDEEELALLDVRDLQALCASLHSRAAEAGGTRWMALLGRRGRVRERAAGTRAAAPLAHLA